MAVSAIAGKFQKTTGMGPPVDSVQLPYKWLNSMVYGRYNELVNGGYFMVYKPTNITGGPIIELDDGKILTGKPHI